MVARMPLDDTRARSLLLVISFVGFVSLGLPDAVVGVAWPSVRETFDLELSRLGLVLIGSGAGYFLSSFFAGRLIHGLGIGSLLAISTALVAVSAAGFAFAPFWPAFVAAALLQGLGSGAIDSGLNSYAASHFTARHMNWLHACYCLGAMLGPLLMTGVLSARQSWRVGYGTIASIMLLLSLLFTATRRRWGTAPSASDMEAREIVGMTATLLHPTVWLQIVLFFLYTGTEVTVGQWTFTVFTQLRKIDPQVAGVWIGIYWGSIGIGRVLLGFVVARVGIDRLIRLGLLAALAGAILLAVPWPGPVPFLGLSLIGLALAPIFPCLMTRTPQRLGVGHAAHAIGFQVSAATLGAAAVPSAVGVAAGEFGLAAVGFATIGLCAALIVLHEGLIRTRQVIAAAPAGES